MRLSKEDYREAVGILKRYNYNCLNIINRQADIISISVGEKDGMPKAKYNISDIVCNKVIQLEEDEELQKSIKEWKIVQQALALITEDSRNIFNKEYEETKRKWEVIDILHISERTYFRRKKDLIFAVHKEIKKWQ